MTIEKIRESIYGQVGNEVRVIYNEGRNRFVSYEGRVIEVYPNIFIVLDSNHKRSFSYRDILTNVIEISFKKNM